MDTEIIEGFPVRLKEAIDNLSNREFGHRSRLSEGTIRSYLAGKTLPTIDRLFRMAKSGEVDVVWLLTGTHPPSSEAQTCQVQCPLLAPSPLTPMDQANALRLARELANILERQRRQTAEAQSLLERVVRIVDHGALRNVQPPGNKE